MGGRKKRRGKEGQTSQLSSEIEGKMIEKPKAKAISLRIRNIRNGN